MANAESKPKKPAHRIRIVHIAQVLTVLALLAYCEYAVRAGLISRVFLAAPSQVWEQFRFMLRKGQIWDNLLLTLEEFGAGYTLAVVSGMMMGVIFVLFPKVEEFLSVFFSAIMAIPKTAILPLLVVWFGIGFKSKIVLILLGCLFTILFNTVTGAKQTRPEFLKVAAVFRTSRFQTVFKVLLPSALPSIFTGLRITAATSITLVVFSEMMASKKGLGYLLAIAQQVLNTAQLFVVIILVTILSVLLVTIVNLTEYAICHKWRPASRPRRG